MPNGVIIMQELQRWIEDEEAKRGYIRTKTPLMAKSDLYKISGHWDHYKDGMFVLGDEEKDKEVYALRPMTCPFQYYVYKAEQHSYRDLPLRYGETSTLFRNEDSGEMHGLTRVRQFTISEGHLIVRPDQMVKEFKDCIALAQYCLQVLGVEEDVTYHLSKWDPKNSEKYIGDAEVWEETEGHIRTMLEELNIPFVEDVGEAAFYGPKVDINAKNVYGKEDTMITIQWDALLAEQFDMYYIDENGEKQRPYIIHRTSMGCYERTLAWLIEKYAGMFPTWLCPEQVRVIPISEKYSDYASKVEEQLKETHEEILHLESVSTALDIALTESDLSQIKEELTECGYIKKHYTKKKKALEKSKPLHYISSDGYHIYVGKNNYQNEELTFKFATGNDWWFHAKKMAGSHVIVKSNNEELPDRTFEEAGRLAAYYSSGRTAPKVEIDYIQKKHVKKPNSSKPGFVVYYTNYSLMIEPDISGIQLAKND